MVDRAPGVKRLTEDEYRTTMMGKMQQLPLDAKPPFDFGDYFDAIPAGDFEGHDCSEASVHYAWSDPTGRFQHALVDSEHKNVFMVIVLDLANRCVYGHRLLDLNREYGLETI